MKTLFYGLICFLVAAFAHAQIDLATIPDEIQNTGFEKPDVIMNAKEGAEPENWFYFCSVEGTSAGVTIYKKKAGAQSLCLNAPPATEAYRGFAQRFKAMPGFQYTFSIHAMNNATNPIVDTSYGQISLEWQNAMGAEISRSYGPIWSANLSPTRWEKISMDDVAPETAAIGVVVITYFSKEANGVGSFYVDDVELQRHPVKKE